MPGLRCGIRLAQEARLTFGGRAGTGTKLQKAEERDFRPQATN